MSEVNDYRPTDKEVQDFISAWDGDIDERTARYLLEIDYWKSKAISLLAAKPEPGEFTKRLKNILEACDRIDSLEAENKRMKQLIESYGNNPNGFDWGVLRQIDEQQAEITQLKSMLEPGEYSAYTQRLKVVVKEKAAEIERLKAELKKVKQHDNWIDDGMEQALQGDKPE